ncbi:hypothetical protein LTR84_008216 [Exophiala bonariae]|uniref:Zinc ribbon domain-containing protein n=1 Tax=Exophiala bonariae TaxID=1690606 RepID=A0AAV9MZM5_9EURO|nr:hypothetical protein LTR84_008216 [Exophiala bonariae]
MSYQPNQYQPNAGEPARASHRPLNKWWPIGFAIASVLLYAIGGGLYGSSCSTDGYYYYCSYGQWSGGIALLSLGGITSTVAVILLIIYLIRRRNPAPYNSGTRMLDQSQFAQPPPVAANVQAPAATYPQYAASKPEADIRELPVNGGKFCGRCGTAVLSAFCPKCGAQA